MARVGNLRVANRSWTPFLFLTFFILLFVCLILSSMVVQKFESLFCVYRQKFCLHTFYLCLSSFKIVSIREWSPTNDKNISLIKNAQTKSPILSLILVLWVMSTKTQRD